MINNLAPARREQFMATGKLKIIFEREMQRQARLHRIRILRSLFLQANTVTNGPKSSKSEEVKR